MAIKDHAKHFFKNECTLVRKSRKSTHALWSEDLHRPSKYLFLCVAPDEKKWLKQKLPYYIYVRTDNLRSMHQSNFIVTSNQQKLLQFDFLEDYFFQPKMP